MSVVISDEILQASQLTPGEFRQEIAIYLFQTGRLTLGYASCLADMQLNAFRQLLKQRKIALYSYDVEDFEVRAISFSTGPKDATVSGEFQ